jgi:nicotinamidase-related amidase
MTVTPETQGQAVPRADLLLLVDVQKAFVEGPHAVPGGERLKAAIGLLLQQARAASRPVLFLQNDGPEGAADAPHQPGWELYFSPLAGEAVLRKMADDGFDATELASLLEKSGARNIAMAGLLSEMCVAATARAAMARGYTVILPHDGHATYDVPPGPGDSPGVPAKMAARAAEWSLGDEVFIPASVRDVMF